MSTPQLIRISRHVGHSIQRPHAGERQEEGDEELPRSALVLFLAGEQLPPHFAFSPGYAPWAGYGHGASGATPAALTAGSAARRCAISPPGRRARMSSSSAHRSLKA